MKYIVVTGCSSGIGFTTTKYLINQGFHVFACVRTEADAENVLAFNPESCTPLVFDLADEAGIKASVEVVRQKIGDDTLFGLVNNAAAVFSGPMAHVTKEEMMQQFEINTFGPMNMAQVYFPLLYKAGKKQGRIVHVTSISGEIAMPFLGPYSASKRALMSICHSMRREFLPFGVDVIEVVPGRVKTGIVDKLPKDAGQFKGSDYEKPMMLRLESAMKMRDFGLEPIVIAKAIHKALTVNKPKTRYVRPDLYWMGWKVPMLLPARTLDRILGKQMHLLPEFLKS